MYYILWIYFVTIFLHKTLLGLSTFIIFFPQYWSGMGLPLDAPHANAAAFAGVVCDYLPDRPLERYPQGTTRAKIGLLVITFGYSLSFLLVVGTKTFFVLSVVTGVAFRVVMPAQLR